MKSTFRLLMGLAVGLVPALPAGAGRLADSLGLDSDVVQQEGGYTCVPLPPPPPPAQHSGAEGMPPLPLPAVPLRRTEKKNPPRPPVLIAKIATADKGDWATNPGDTENLLRWMAETLDVHFSSMNLPEDQIPADPREIPVLYRTGHEAFAFSPAVRERLRAYLLGGGTLILDACCGRRAFVESALTEMEQLLPERPPYLLTLDHPVFHSFHDIKPADIRYRPWARKAGAEDGVPAIVGIDIECRTAVFFFRWDVSCGWDALADSDRHHCLGHETDCSRILGANLMAYLTAERSAAIPLSKALDFADAARDRSGKFVIAQGKYGGQWKTRSAGLGMLLNAFHEQTQTPVRFERDELPLDSARLFDVPFLYLTGHQDFELTDRERRNLREYVTRGGLIFAEACCGREGFDAALRRELAAIFPGAELAAIPPTHPVFLFPNALAAVQPRPALARRLGVGDAIAPVLFGLNVDSRLGVVYSPVGLACGWELADCPHCCGLAANDALALGVNILTHAITE
ncbi:MAG: hypothetical protein BWZ02_01841 [Lentisphaerae bacterium ADurb.BinA184]|nr:MAG: hypothetical protein BWZ02_01841 [Lentisphaerae bacterium ADurb.BinA184]